MDLASILNAPTPAPQPPSAAPVNTQQLQEQIAAYQKKVEHITQLLGDSEASVDRLTEQAKARIIVPLLLVAQCCRS